MHIPIISVYAYTDNFGFHSDEIHHKCYTSTIPTSHIVDWSCRRISEVQTIEKGYACIGSHTRNRQLVTDANRKAQAHSWWRCSPAASRCRGPGTGLRRGRRRPSLAGGCSTASKCRSTPDARKTQRRCGLPARRATSPAESTRRWGLEALLGARARCRLRWAHRRLPLRSVWRAAASSDESIGEAQLW